MDFLARCLFARETTIGIPLFINVTELWEGRVATYNDVILVRNHPSAHVGASRLMHDNGAEDVVVPKLERTTAAWKQLHLFLTHARGFLGI